MKLSLPPWALLCLTPVVFAGFSHAATFTVTTTANSGAGSLHQAILDANAAAGADTIAFDIATASKTITPPGTAALPTITEALTIDGTTQPGFAGVPLIELNGTSGPALSNGLLITASDCVIRGLVINRWKGDGIEIQGGANNVIEGCYVGVSLAGSADQGNALSGVFINGSANNRIGTPDKGNVISGNEDHGVLALGAASTGNRIQGNRIGQNATGAAALGNTDHGIWIQGAPGTQIGGTASGEGNFISGNRQHGIFLSVAGTADTIILGNFIGLDGGGVLDQGNTLDGIHVAGVPGTVIGGTAVGARNVISGNNSDGIELNGAGAIATVIEGNFIGLRGTSGAAVANSVHGVFVNGAVNTRIGGTTANAGNTISGNTQHGIALSGATTAGTVIQGNFIGLDSVGTTDLGNGQDGINVNGVAGTVIGGTTLAARNLIAGNTGDGVELTGAATQNTVIEGNFVGSDQSGTVGVANGGAGVLITSAATKNRVGGTAAGQANRIAFNTGDGVFINGGPENVVRGNSIHSNGGLGIDLGSNGVQSNDTTDNDTGANLLQNFPVLTEAVLLANDTKISATFQSTPNTMFALDFYANEAADAAGNGEGQTWLESLDVQTDATGFAAFTVTLPKATTQRFISATATDPAGNTSEFSAARRAVTTATPASFAVTTTADSGAGSLRQAILDANAALNEGDRITFSIPGEGPHTISPATALPALLSPVTLDGYSEPGAVANTLADGFNATLKILLDGNAISGTPDGLRAEAPRATVRGLVITRFRGDGIEIPAGGSSSVVEGCVIGLGLDGADLGNNVNGVLITGSLDNQIGGPAAARRNVISGNGRHGIEINGAAATGNMVQGNFIGTDLAGTARVGNSTDGVHITVGPANHIGGAEPGAGNVIGGNNGDGLELENANNTFIHGNRIGVAFNGAEIRNSGNGVILNNASDTRIGGADTGQGNVIALNSGRGITLLNNTSQRNTFRGNPIFANGNLGIDLFNNGRTLNDAGDADTGPNNFQNFPELTGAITEAAATKVTGTFNSAASATFTLEFFASTAADSTGFGEGEQFLGSAQVTTDAEGNAAFDLSLPTRAIGRFIAATATAADGSTSEFSAVVRATSTIPPQTFAVINTDDSGPGSLRQAMLDADEVMTGAPHRIVFNIPGDGPHTITPATSLPVPASEPVELDGFTQPGASANTLVNGHNAVHKIRLDGAAIPFSSPGLRFTLPGNIVRGLALTRFNNGGVELAGNGNVVEGCLVGIAPDGSSQPNGRSGLAITGTATGNRIGGAAPAARNAFAGNGGQSVEIASSVGGNRVLGNFIGTLDGTTAAPGSPAVTGIAIVSSPDNVIGGAAAGEGNVISGHSGNGVTIREPGATRNRVLGNFIGTDATGLNPLPNSDGVNVNNAPGNFIGGPTPGEGNRLAFNLSDGVSVTGFSTRDQNAIRGNTIFGNGSLGIDLSFDGVLENDPGDADGVGDSTANLGQNFPVLTAATATAANVTVQGTLNSVASKSFTLDFFANVVCDDSGNGQGQQYLGSATTATGPDGNATFSATLPVLVIGRYLTATATDPDGNTSEFSDCFEAATEFASETFLVTNTNDSGDGSFRDALLKNNASVAGENNRIEFNVPGAGPHVFTPASTWPAITHAVTIDGYTQPGAKANTLAVGGDAVLKIHLEAGTSSGSRALELLTTGSVVRGLAITKWFTGIEIKGGGNRIQGNFIGLNPAGDNIGTANGIGLSVAAGDDHVIGGTAPADRNLISGNNASLQVGGNGTVIQGNYFGLDPTGSLPRANAQPISLFGDNLRLGGDVPGAGNVISATGDDAVRLGNANHCLIQGNFIGTDATGQIVRANNGNGISIGIGTDNLIGGATPGARNVISGNVAALSIGGGNRVLGNLIGVAADGVTPLGNQSGLLLNGSGIIVGGVALGEGNIIAHGRLGGIFHNLSTAVNNSIRGNRIFGNVGFGIDLGSFGLNPNDALDADTGPNLLQNHPVLASGEVRLHEVHVSGLLESAPSTIYVLDFYANRSPDDSGAGEGEQYLGSINLATDDQGRGPFSQTFTVDAIGRHLTVTATDPAGNTSEFSPTFRAASTRSPVPLTVVNTDEDGPGSLADALRQAGTQVAGEPVPIRFNIPGGGIRTIFLKGPLPVVDEAVELDGFSQPGSLANTGTDSNNALWQVELNGDQSNGDGLRFTSVGNVIRGLSIRNFPGAGIHLDGGGQNTIQGCVIVGNRGDGIRVTDSPDNLIGGAEPGHRNLIANNPSSGISFTGTDSTDNRVLGNFIGLSADGLSPVGNTRGVVFSGAIGNQIGGVNPGEANWIAFNNGEGVLVAQGGDRNAIRGNRIFTNRDSGILLSGAGANQRQSFPVLTSANVVPAGLRVGGTLNSGAQRTFLLDFYHIFACDSSGRGEGATHLGFTTVTTDATGNLTFDVTLPGPVARGVITATATDLDGNTSEFSQCRELGTEIPPQTYLVTTTADSGPGSLRQAILDANAAFTTGVNTIAFNLPGSGVQMIQPLSPLPAITQRVKVDGYTQPGAAPDTSGKTLNHVLRVRLDGAQGGTEAGGLAVTGPDVHIRGLIITRFAKAGIRLNGAHRAVIEGNWLGTDGSNGLAPAGGGTARQGRPSRHGPPENPVLRQLGNEFGIHVTGVNGVAVGNAPAVSGSTGNLISGNVQSGAFLDTTTAATLRNNFIGTGPGGDNFLGNGRHGVDVLDSRVSVVNSTISGNTASGVHATSSNPDSFTEQVQLGIENSTIGANPAQTEALGNGEFGIHAAGLGFNSGLNLLNSTIAGNPVGLGLVGESTRNGLVIGNRFGVGGGGGDDVIPLPNEVDVLIGGGVFNQIGGPTPAEFNYFASPASIVSPAGGNDLWGNYFTATATPDLGAPGPDTGHPGAPRFTQITTVPGDDSVQVNFEGQGDPNEPVIVFPFGSTNIPARPSPEGRARIARAALGGAFLPAILFVPGEPTAPIIADGTGKFSGSVSIPQANPLEDLLGLTVGTLQRDSAEIIPIAPQPHTADVRVTKIGPTEGRLADVLEFTVTVEAVGLQKPLIVTATDEASARLSIIAGEALDGNGAVIKGGMQIAYLTASLIPASPVARFRIRCRAESDGSFTNRAYLFPPTLIEQQFTDSNPENNDSTVTGVIGEGTNLADFGDAPDTYGTTLAANGARHRDPPAALGPAFGELPDRETDGTPSAQADGDGPDEDGITFNGPLAAGQLVKIGLQVNPLNDAGLVSAWLDFNRDGDFNDPLEQFAASQPSTGLTELSVLVPANAVLGQTYARFRISTQAGLDPIGEAPDGEVEDYVVNIIPGNSAPRLSVTLEGSDTLRFIWDPAVGIVLKQGPTPEGQFTPVLGQTPPPFDLTVPPGSGANFFTLGPN